MVESLRTLVPTSDGRELEVLVTGPEDGFPLVYHHGTPQGAAPFPHLEHAALERGLRVVAWSRPGYGASTPRPDGATTARVADDARDTEAALDHLGMGEFLTIGWSGGGPRALACAAVLPGRCRAAACCVGIAPKEEYDGDLRDGMAEENVAEYTAAFAGVTELEKFLATQEKYFSVTADGIAGTLGGLAPPVDRAALTGELAEYLAASTRAAGQQGIVGWRDDDLTHLCPWGFSVRDITVPVSLWQGREDTMVPIAHGEWLAANVAGVRAHLVDGEGHLSLMIKFGAILDELLELGGLRHP
jgi:pimeloyl-ACP methyl ester carboxylesterase